MACFVGFNSVEKRRIDKEAEEKELGRQKQTKANVRDQKEANNLLGWSLGTSALPSLFSRGSFPFLVVNTQLNSFSFRKGCNIIKRLMNIRGAYWKTCLGSRFYLRAAVARTKATELN